MIQLIFFKNRSKKRLPKTQLILILFVFTFCVFFNSCRVLKTTTSDNFSIIFNKGAEYFNQKKYIEADSLFTIAINDIPDVKVYRYKAFARHHLNDIKGYCHNLRIAYDLGDTIAKNKYCSTCVTIETKKDSNIQKIITRDKYENYYSVIEMSNTNDTLLTYYFENNIRIYKFLGKGVNPVSDTLAEIKLLKFIGSNVHYPEEAKEFNIQGKAYVTFIVEEDGTLSNFKISKSSHALLSRAALEVMRKVPKILIVKYKNEPIKCVFTIPINFRLN